MYLRADHAEYDIPLLRQFIRDNPLGILITALPSSNFPTIQISHIPWLLDVADEASSAELGNLRGHMAKRNPHSKALVEAIQAHNASNGSLETEVSILFNGPVHHYITPKFYTETKPATGKVVPTWNYSAVQVYGKATILFDPKTKETGAFLTNQVQDLTKHAEGSIMNYAGGERPSAWEVSDAPASYVELLQKNIIGISIKVERLEGKFKMNQEMGKRDREGVIQGFEALGTEQGQKMAKSVEERGALKDARASESLIR
jgi:transcriptional regulator